MVFPLNLVSAFRTGRQGARHWPWPLGHMHSPPVSLPGVLEGANAVSGKRRSEKAGALYVYGAVLRME
jgi:hypothetical protein